MWARERGPWEPNDEVDDIMWVPLSEVDSLLTYESDRELAEQVRTGEEPPPITERKPDSCPGCPALMASLLPLTPS